MTPTTAVVRCAATMLMTERRPPEEVAAFLAAITTGTPWGQAPR